MKRFFAFLLLWLVVAMPLQAAIRAVDADGRKIRLDEPDRTTVVIYSNENLQKKTREAGKSLYPLQGLPEFKVVVIVDLHNSLALWAKNYTQYRMRKDLDEEAKRIEPFYRKNGNNGSPRKDVAAVADFDGSLCEKLHFMPGHLQAVVFGKNGKEVLRWTNLTDYDAFHHAVEGVVKNQTVKE